MILSSPIYIENGSIYIIEISAPSTLSKSPPHLHYRNHAFYRCFVPNVLSQSAVIRKSHSSAAALTIIEQAPQAREDPAAAPQVEGAQPQGQSQRPQRDEDQSHGDRPPPASLTASVKKVLSCRPDVGRLKKEICCSLEADTFTILIEVNQQQLVLVIR